MEAFFTFYNIWGKVTGVWIYGSRQSKYSKRAKTIMKDVPQYLRRKKYRD